MGLPLRSPSTMHRRCEVDLEADHAELSQGRPITADRRAVSYVVKHR